MYFGSVVHKLVLQIRHRGMVQFFTPYSSVHLDKMAAAFNSSCVANNPPPRPTPPPPLRTLPPLCPRTPFFLLLAAPLAALVCLVPVLACVRPWCRTRKRSSEVASAAYTPPTPPPSRPRLLHFPLPLPHRADSVEQLTREVVELVMSGTLQARIDSKAGVLVSQQADDRVEAFEKASAVAQAFVRDTRAALLRLNLLKHGVSVRAAYPSGGSGLLQGGGEGGAADGGSMGGGGDDMMDD
jgi:hypothetical protein